MRNLFIENKMIKQFEIKNSDLSCKIINYGATVTDLVFKNRHIVLRFEYLENYRKTELNQSFGSSVGRVANRISDAKFHLNNQNYNLEKNAGVCCLHGGSKGFAFKIWDLVHHQDDKLVLELKSEHLDQNFPGSIMVTACFSLLNNALLIDYSAKLDETNSPDLATIVNLTNHTYFNLNGCTSAEKATNQTDTITIRDHEVFSSDAKAILEQDSNQVSTGRLINLENADPLFRINQKFLSLRDGCARGLYDHSFAFETNRNQFTVLSTDQRYKFEALSRQSNIKLIVETNNPSCHMYTGPRTPILGYQPLSGVCFEAQSFPNACNIDDWLDQCLVTKDKPYSKFISFALESLD